MFPIAQWIPMKTAAAMMAMTMRDQGKIFWRALRPRPSTRRTPSLKTAFLAPEVPRRGPS
jgi:hypothetical protein